MEYETKISRRDQIINTSSLLFKDKGYMATTMRDIAKELGIEAASLYNHIKSKDEILEAICFRMADQFMRGIDEVNDIYFNAEEKLRMAIQNHVKIICSEIDASTVFLHEWRHLTEPKLSEFKEHRHRYQNEFRVIIQQGEDENIFEAVDKKFAVLTILSTVNWITEWYSPGGRITPEEIAENLGDFILKGLKKKSA